MDGAGLSFPLLVVSLKNTHLSKKDTSVSHKGVRLTVKKVEWIIMDLPTSVKRTLYKKKKQNEK